MALSTRSSPPKCGSGRIHKLRSKGLSQVKLGPISMTTQRFRTQTDLRSSVHLENNVPEQRKPEPRESQADRPRRGRPASNCRCWSYATVTDLKRRSRASLQRQWPRGHIPRPAGLGEAGRPHSAASQAPASRGNQAQPPATDATCFTCSEPTLEGYK